MNSYQQISEFFSENGKRKASVRKEDSRDGANYFVSATNDTGSTFVCSFNNIDEAEDFAEEWVMNE